MGPLLAAMLLVAYQGDPSESGNAHDRRIDLEIAATDEPGIPGRGPTAVVEYEAAFEGTLHVWAASDVDLFLQVDDATEATVIAADDNSGGGTTPYLAVDVSPGDWLVVLVAGPLDTAASLSLHLISAPVTDEGRKAEAAGRAARADAARLIGEGRRAEARMTLQRALPAVLRTGEISYPDLIELREDLAFVLEELGDLHGAQKLDRSVLRDREHALPPDHADLLSSRANMAVYRLSLGDLVGARALNEAVVAALERTVSAEDPALLRAQTNLAGIMHMMGELAEARQLREWILEASERVLPVDHPDLLRARGNLANSMQEMGEHPGARKLFEALIESYERILPEDHPDLLLSRANLAISLRRMGDVSGARALREKVLVAYERSLPSDHPSVVRARSNLANSLHDLGDLAGARALREACLRAYDRRLSEDHIELTDARLNLAVSMQEMGDLEGARSLYELVLTARERALPADHPGILIARTNLAGTMLLMGDMAEAQEIFASVLEVYERTQSEDHLELLAARANYGNAAFSMGDLALARRLFESNLTAYERVLPEDHPDLSRARASLAIALGAMGELVDAHDLQESVLASSERVLPEDHPDLSRARAHTAISRANLGDLDGGRALVVALIAGMERRVLSSVALAPRQARQSVWSEGLRLSEVLFLTKAAGEALERSAFQLTETMRMVAAESARSLIRFEADGELRPLLDEATAVRRALNDLVAGSPPEGASEEVTRLSLERDRLERRASQLLAERGVVTDPVEPSKLSRALGDGDVAVGFRRIAHWEMGDRSRLPRIRDERFIAHVLKPSGELTRVDIGPAAAVEDAVSAWCIALGVPVLRGISVETGENETEVAAGQRLRNLILDPVFRAAGEGVQRLFICADDLLFLVPLDALPMSPIDGESRGGAPSRVGDRVQIVNEVSFARLLTPFDSVERTPSLLAIGGVDYDAPGAVPGSLQPSSAAIEVGEMEPPESEMKERPADAGSRGSRPERFQKLLQSRLETEAIGILFEEAFQVRPTSQLGKAATKAALFKAAKGARFLHLATHGWFAPDSVRSIGELPGSGRRGQMDLEQRLSGLAPMTLCGIALAGANRGRDSLGRVPGILTAEELCSLDLSQCELAVLSACDTNVGIRRAGLGIQSLQAALYAAGARTSVTSLWSVDDGATRRLMEIFYTNLWSEKMSKLEALWQAKRSMSEEGYPPVDWAGWVLTGDPE